MWIDGLHGLWAKVPVSMLCLPIRVSTSVCAYTVFACIVCVCAMCCVCVCVSRAALCMCVHCMFACRCWGREYVEVLNWSNRMKTGHLVASQRAVGTHGISQSWSRVGLFRQAKKMGKKTPHEGMASAELQKHRLSTDTSHVIQRSEWVWLYMQL